MITDASTRGLTSRSVILSLLLGLDDVDAPVSGILSTCAELGLRESSVRVALTRLVAAGDLERTDGRYRLSPRLRERQQRQEAALHPVTSTPWDGTWHMVVETGRPSPSTDRAEMRTSMHAARLGALRSGVWARPTNVELVLPPTIRGAVDVFTAVPQESGQLLSGRLFDTAAWAQTARSAIDDLTTSATVGERFVSAAVAVRHLLDDPILPPELLPADWPGDDLRAGYLSFRDELTTLGSRILTR